LNLEFRKELLNDLKPIDAHSIHTIYNLSSLEILNIINIWLNNGIEAENLFQLCSVNPTDFSKINSLFLNALDELKVLKSNECEISKCAVKVIFEKMIDNKIDTELGAREVINIEGNLKLSCYEIKEGEERYAGNKLALERLSCWNRELSDCLDGSMLFYYTELPRDEALIKIKEEIILAAHNWIKEHC